MPHGPDDPRWSRLLGLAVHEFRTPITVVAGYIRMLLKERAGPISEQQRRLLEEAEKSCGRLSALVSEMSDLSNLEAGTAAFNRSSVALDDLLREAIAAIPAAQDREVAIDLDGGTSSSVQADATRLRAAFASLLQALRREVVTADRLVVRTRQAPVDGRSAAVIAIAEPEHIEAVAAADAASLGRFDEWRGGSGLSLAVARRIIGQHGGALLGPPGDGKAGAVVVLPI